MTKSRDLADNSQNTKPKVVINKGDLIVGTQQNSADRLGVGSNGYTLVADSSTSTGLAYGSSAQNNPVINGAFDIWQRGTSIVAGTKTYNADRWITGRSAWAAGTTTSRQTTSDTTNLPNIQYAARVQRDSGNTGTGVIFFNTSFENVNSTPFIGQTITLSFYARRGANYSSASNVLTMAVYSGTGTDQNVNDGFTGSTQPVTGNATLTTTWQRFSYSGTVSSSAKQLAIEFQYTPVGTAGANDWFEVTGVQIDLGSTALPFRRSGGTIQGELAACQRYYFRYASSQYLGAGHMQSTTAADVYIKTPVTMRSAPTYAAASGTNYFQVATSAATTAYSTIGNFYGAGTDGVLGRVTVSGFTAGQGCVLVLNNASAWVEGSAEL